MAKKKIPIPPKTGKKTPELPFAPPRTTSTWVCQRGHINHVTDATCRGC